MTKEKRRKMEKERHEQNLSKRHTLSEYYVREFHAASTDWERLHLTGIIYRIVNLVNMKSYIGQTINWFDYRYRNGKWWHHTNNPILKKAVAKYGLQNFVVFILDFNVQTIEELNFLEVKYIAEYKTFIEDGCGYNLDRGGNNKNCSEETREKLSKSTIGRKHSQETKDKMSKTRKGMIGPMLGKSHSEKSKKLLSDLNTGENNAFYGKKHSQETKDKISNFCKNNKKAQEHIIKLAIGNTGRKQNPEQIAKRAKANKKSINQIDVNTGVIIKTWLSSKDAGEFLSHSNSSITAVCKGKAKSAAGFFWSYA